MTFLQYLGKQGVIVDNGKFFNQINRRFLTGVETENIYSNYNYHYGNSATPQAVAVSSKTGLLVALGLFAILFLVNKS